jgi:hypothetical protein
MNGPPILNPVDPESKTWKFPKGIPPLFAKVFGQNEKNLTGGKKWLS